MYVEKINLGWLCAKSLIHKHTWSGCSHNFASVITLFNIHKIDSCLQQEKPHFRASWVFTSVPSVTASTCLMCHATSLLHGHGTTPMSLHKRQNSASLTEHSNTCLSDHTIVHPQRWYPCIEKSQSRALRTCIQVPLSHDTCHDSYMPHRVAQPWLCTLPNRDPVTMYSELTSATPSTCLWMDACGAFISVETSIPCLRHLH